MSKLVYFEGIEELSAKIKDNVTLNDVKRVVRVNGSQLQRKIEREAIFRKGYSTGATKRSIGLKIKDNGLTAESKPTTEYAEYVEWGTRKMEAQPFVRVGFGEQRQKFRSDMEKLVR